MKYKKQYFENDIYIITDFDKDYKHPQKSITTAFDTETITFCDNEQLSQKEIFERLKECNTEEKRKRLRVSVWAWQCYDEINGFFMTNDFIVFCKYLCKVGCDFSWCYNSTFDFAQIDYKILCEYKDRFKPHISKNGKVYNKAQPYTYESIHNAEGARYAYKLWIPYKNDSRHIYTHSIEFRDFMKIMPGGLAKILEDLNVKDTQGMNVRKLTMEYQAIDYHNLSDADIDYCCNDVKGLYYAIKQFNTTIEEQTNNELHIFGKDTNIMTAGGFAKSELLRSLYPNLDTKKKRLKQYQKDHPLTPLQDKFFRENHLYRGGIAFVNPYFKGRLLTEQIQGQKMNRYDVNSEYPYSMSILRDLVGKPIKMTLKDYEIIPNKNEYECIYVIKSIFGTLKSNMLGIWYDPFRNDYVDIINEQGMHLMFKEEFDELTNWYDLQPEIEDVILFKKGNYVYKPYVDKNYELKALAKKQGNKCLQTTAKLNLNSSYGKLAERIEREVGHYELNNDTGAIHFIRDNIEDSTSSQMSVVVGAKVTSIARCYILSKIREICKNPQKQFVYIDTDSIHCFANYANADAYSLGGLKLEAQCQAVKYILPKTYIDIEKIDLGGKIDTTSIECHTKGVNTKVVMQELIKQENLTLQEIDQKFDYGAKFIVLQAMNVIGGKCLIPVEKYLARPELQPNFKINNGYINEI